MIAEVVAELGGVDILINNAAIYQAHPIATCTFEEWQQSWQETLEINLLGAAPRHLLGGPTNAAAGRRAHCQYFLAGRLSGRTGGFRHTGPARRA